MAELTKTQVSEKVKKALDWIVADSTTKANNAKTQAINDAASRYLPLAGGTMSGTVATHATCGMRQTSNDQFLEFFGGTQYNLGALIRVDGKDSLRKGSFHVEARNDNGTGVLEGTPEGVLTWQSKNIVRSVNGINADAAGDVAISTVTNATRVTGTYTGNGGQQNPSYFGKTKIGFLMMNTPINGDSSYKDFMIMDTYHGTDAGGATAIGVSRTGTKAFIMSSNSDRSSWNRTAELMTSTSAVGFPNPSTKTLLTINVDHTISANGWLQMYAYRYDKYSEYLYVDINGTRVFSISGAGDSRDNVMCPVKKGDIVRYSQSGGLSEVRVWFFASRY